MTTEDLKDCVKYLETKEPQFFGGASEVPVNSAFLAQMEIAYHTARLADAQEKTAAELGQIVETLDEFITAVNVSLHRIAESNERKSQS